MADLLAGNFVARDEFDTAEPGHEWLQVHVPKQKWYQLMDGTLVIQPLAVKLDEKRNASFYARRQAHQRFAASTEFTPPRGPGTAAGLAAYQSESHWYFFGARRVAGGLQLFLERSAGQAATREDGAGPGTRETEAAASMATAAATPSSTTPATDGRHCTTMTMLPS